tara:strand:+ start:3718 stop:4218 length:501 start_codon:yes stop_codon:yes gene_type:complete
MPKHIPESIKLKAMKLYVSGDKTAKEIADIVSQDGVPVKTPTIYAWAKKEKWGQQKAVAITDEQQKVAETEGARFARMQREQLDNYSVVASKAYTELDGLHFDKALDAVKAIDVGIKGQREVLSGMINLQFVQDVLGILIEEISDQDTLNKIAVKLKTLVQQQEDM